MKQIWSDLLFAHWPIPPAALQPLIPPQLTLDSFEGECWVGVVPFRISGLRVRAVPSLPGLSTFPELNVRTYVTYGGKAGVYFFSLDAANLPAVWAARTFYHLPYFHAAMTCTEEGGFISYSSRRFAADAEFRASYKPVAPVCIRGQGSLADWLTARFCLYTVHKSKIYRCDIHHLPWPLQDAEASLQRNTAAAAAQIALPDTVPLSHFSHRLEVLVWPLRLAEQRV